MTDQVREDRIRTKAYDLWEQSGRPDDMTDFNWHRATELISTEDDQSYLAEPHANLISWPDLHVEGAAEVKDALLKNENGSVS